MAQYFEDWSGSTIGQGPTGWTPRWSAEASTWSIVDIGSGQKALRYYTAQAAPSRNGLSFDAIDADVDRANFEIVFKWRVDTVGQYGPQIKGWGRATGTIVSTTQSSYLGGIDCAVDVAAPLRLQKYVAGTSATIGTSQPFEVATDTWYITRFRVNGTTLQQKTWLASESEPGTWQRTETDTSLSSAGWVGLFAFNARFQHDIEWVGAATAGDAAPMTDDIDPLATPQGTTTITNIAPGTTSAVITYSYSAGDATGFEYRINGGTAASISESPSTMFGLTAGTPYSFEVRAVNAAGAGAWSAVYNFTTTASGDTTPPDITGSVTFASVTQTSYTASWPAGSDNVAVTGYEYQIGSTAGAWTDAGNNLSAAITGRTAGTTETVYVRAYDAAGLRSLSPISGEVTLSAPVLTKKLRIDETLYVDKAKTATFSGTADVTVLNRSATRSIAYQANAMTITDGALDITTAAFVTLAAQFDVVIVVSGTVRGVFPATVVED